MRRFVQYQQQRAADARALDQKGAGRGRGRRGGFAFSSPLTRLMASHVGRGHSASFMQQIAEAATLEGQTSDSPAASLIHGFDVSSISIYTGSNTLHIRRSTY